MMAYLFLANISLIVFYSIYHIFLRKLTFFQGNRIYLLTAVVLSLILPTILFIDLSGFAYKSNLMPTISLELSELTIPEIEIGTAHYFWQINWNFVVIYWFSITFAAIYLFIRIFRLYQRFNERDGEASFSFLNFVHIGVEARTNTIIHRHELVHVQQGHSYDILFLEIVRVFNWFNPIFFLYIRALKFQHEYIADQLCAAEDKTSYAELLIANALRVSTDVLSHEFASESILKKRIMMLFQHKSKKSNQWKYLMMLPITVIISLMGLVLNHTVDAKTNLIHQVMDVKLPVVSQTISAIMETDPQDKIYDDPEILPLPPGGMNTYLKFIGQHFKYSNQMIENKVNGIIEVQFVVEIDGSVTHVKAKNDLGFGAAQAAEDVVKSDKKWKPGVYNGKPVRVAFTLPLKIVAMRFPVPIVAEDNVPNVKRQENNNSRSPNTIFTAVEVAPSPPQGMSEFIKYIGANYVYPDEAVDQGVNGVVEVSFLVEKDGSLSNFEIKRDLKYGTGQAAIDVLKKYPEKWKPGIQSGRSVQVAYTLPIRLNTVLQ